MKCAALFPLILLNSGKIQQTGHLRSLLQIKIRACSSAAPFSPSVRMESPSLLGPKNPTTNDDEESVKALLEKMITNPGKIQNQVLEEIPAKNSKTEYLSRFFADANDDDVKQVFKKKVPLVEYTDLLPYIERIANGEPHHIVSADPILEFICSSGTTGGKYKLFPGTAQQLGLQASVIKLTSYILNKHFVDDDQPLNGKRMFLCTVAPEFTTPGYLVARSGIASLKRKSLAESPSLNPPYVIIPPEVTLCEDVKQSMYCQLLCGLLKRESVLAIGTVFGAGFVQVIKFLGQHREEICCNIRQGRISDWIDDPKCRGALSNILSRPMPDLADEISKEFEKKSWEGIIKKLWPGAKFIEAVVTGSMAQYIPKLEFYGGGLPIASMIYAASEGNFGINLKPFGDPYDISYCLVPWMAYYEFLPVDPISDDNADIKNGGVVDLVNVKIGQHYELVVTTFSGLNRYKMGDILMVTAFHKNAPQFRFVRRKNVVLSLLSDKTTEEDLIKATSKAINSILEPHGFFLTDYTSYADSGSFHYVLFWELQNHGELGVQDNGFVEMMKGCCNVVDQSLDDTYRYYRIHNTIGPLEIKVVKQGTFDALMDFTLSRRKSTSPSQYKPVKCITSEDAIQMMNSMVMATFFSE
ncbi:OLC1v1019569C1 [Oldenlandia corymbosa var. corymbosa]|uniref:OLC1v1019569C1 n=1 Tax=Oldenlandia corymbosa var. corymbosa TaxID=529605 RepID=A0AAV1EE87_OLDCO|nr:OLC1v1019569C1 [Oldenlandia corymbosa var. corymbosa]